MTLPIIVSVVLAATLVFAVVMMWRMRKLVEQAKKDIGAAFAEKRAEMESKKADAALADVAELRSKAAKIKEDLVARHEAEKGKHDAVDRADDHAGVDSVIFDERR